MNGWITGWLAGWMGTGTSIAIEIRENPPIRPNAYSNDFSGGGGCRERRRKEKKKRSILHCVSNHDEVVGEPREGRASIHLIPLIPSIAWVSFFLSIKELLS